MMSDTKETKDTRLSFRLDRAQAATLRLKAEKDGGLSAVLRRLVALYIAGRAA